MVRLKAGEIVTKQDMWWHCACGARNRLAADTDKRGERVCTHCGLKVESTPETPEDTQMVNIAEMARMAQEGLDIGVSGEWDTSLRRSSGQRKERDD